MIGNLLTQPGAILVRTQDGPEDEYGTPTWNVVSEAVVCHVQPRTSEEITSAGAAGATAWRGWFPAGTFINPAAALLLDDGRTFEFVGPPRPWFNPSVGEEQHVEADLERIERPEWMEES